MKSHILSAALVCAITVPLQAGLITNGGFESGFTGWVRTDQTGSEGTFLLQSGATSPNLLLPVPVPPEGSSAAMIDASGPGSHVLYQDFVVPTLIANALLNFSLYFNNTAGAFFVPSPDTLDFSTPALNQQARVDITTTGNVVLQNVYRTNVGDAANTSAYIPFLRDVTSVLQANAGQTLRLRVAEVDNVSIFNLGIDAVDINVNGPAAVPEPATFTLAFGALAAAAIRKLRRR